MSINTEIFDDRSSAFIYAGGWFRDGTWTASNGQSGTLSGTNDQTASVTFTFPVAATAFRYYGMKRGHGGLYGICVDCDPNNPSFSTIDAFDPTDDGRNPPSLLFSQSFSSPSVHVIIIYNAPDPRGQPPGNSQLTLDRFELDVPLPPANTVTLVTTTNATTTVVQPHPQSSSNDVPPSTQLSTTVLQVTTASTKRVSSSLAVSSIPASLQSRSRKDSATPVLSSTTAASGGNVTAGLSPSMALTTGTPHTTPLGAIIGGALGVLAAIAALIILIWWLRKKKGGTSASTTAGPRDAPESATTVPAMSAATSVPTTGYGAGAPEGGGLLHRYPSSNPASPLRSPQRELDAGSISYLNRDGSDDVETLPPDYKQATAPRKSTGVHKNPVE